MVEHKCLLVLFVNHYLVINITKYSQAGSALELTLEKLFPKATILTKFKLLLQNDIYISKGEKRLF